MLYRKPLRITNQGGDGMAGRQRLFEKFSPYATRGPNDQNIHDLLLHRIDSDHCPHRG
jgi:hypothetical protein